MPMHASPAGRMIHDFYQLGPPPNQWPKYRSIGTWLSFLSLAIGEETNCPGRSIWVRSHLIHLLDHRYFSRMQRQCTCIMIDAQIYELDVPVFNVLDYRPSFEWNRGRTDLSLGLEREVEHLETYQECLPSSAWCLLHKEHQIRRLQI